MKFPAAAAAIVVATITLAGCASSPQPTADASRMASETIASIMASDPAFDATCKAAVAKEAPFTVDWDTIDRHWTTAVLSNRACPTEKAWVAAYEAVQLPGTVDPARAMQWTCEAGSTRHEDSDSCADWQMDPNAYH